MTPRVSVLIGAYNNATTLERAIDSMLAQTVSDLELLAIDDGSYDAPPPQVARVAARDPRVRPLPMGRNLGISRSLNEGLAAARRWSPSRTPTTSPSRRAWSASSPPSTQGPTSRSSARGCTRSTRTVGRLRRARASPPATSTTCCCATTRYPTRRVRFAVTWRWSPGGYDPRYRYAMEHDLWLRLAESHRVIALDEALSTRVMGSSNVAARAERAQTAEAIAIRLRALRRRRTVRGASALAVPALAWLTPTALKRARRRRLGQAP